MSSSARRGRAARRAGARARRAGARRVRRGDGLLGLVARRDRRLDGDSLYFLKRHASTPCSASSRFAVCSRGSTTAASRRSRAAAARLASACSLLVAGRRRRRVNGAQRWLAAGPLHAPALRAREARRCSCSRAALLAARRHAPRDAARSMRPVGAAAASLCASWSCVQPDLGSAIAVALAAGAVLVVAGVPGRRAGAHRRRGRRARRVMIYARAVPPRAPARVPRPLEPEHGRTAATRSCRRMVALGRGGLDGRRPRRERAEGRPTCPRRTPT